MSALFNPNPLVLGALQNLSLILDRSTSMSRGQGMMGLTPSTSEARAFGGIGMNVSRSGQSKPAKMRYGAITITPRAQGSAFSKSAGVHPAIDRAYDNPGVRFGDKSKGHERPVSSRGESSCHFSQTSVSKTSPIREMIKAARGGRKITGSKAAAHVLYVERDGAPEQIKKREQEKLAGEKFTAEIEKKGVDRSAVKQQEYIERPGAAEGMERTPQRTITDEDLDELETASFGTIGDNVEERTIFWVAVEENERSPKGDTVKISPAENPEWWAKAVAGLASAPSFIQEPIRGSAARNDMKPFEIKIPTEKAFKLHQWAVGIHTEAPIEISPGRGGRTQTRVIAELPHELDGRERLQIVKDFTDKLAEKGFPFWAVIHAPDANNDARNFHVHIAYYDRPAAKIPKPDGTGEAWDFTIGEEVRFANRHTRMTYPYRQNRDRETHDREWITDLRTHWEAVSNRALDKAGVSKRYNLGTYESMGIDAEPLKHINSRTFNKERKGELTEEGPVLARRQWDNVHDRLVKENEEQARARQKRIEGLADHATRLVRSQPGAELKIKDVQNLKELGIKASLQLALLELQQDLTRLVTDRVASRAKLMMHAADKEEITTRKKRGMALDAPSGDHPVAGASLLGMRNRSEVLRYLTAVYGGGLTLDKDNGARTAKAKTNVQIIVQELRDWISNPAKPPAAIRRFSPSVVRSLDDPARLADSAAIKVALAKQFQKSMDAKAPQILSAIKADIAPSRAATPAPQPPQTAQQATPRRTTPPSTVAADKPVSKVEPTKPRYVAGRPEEEVKPTEPASRARPAPITPAELRAWARKNRERNAPQPRPVADAIVQQRPNTSVMPLIHPVLNVEQIPANAAPVAPAQPTGRMTTARPLEAVVPSLRAMPTTATPSVQSMSAGPDTQIPGISSVAETKRMLIDFEASVATRTVEAEAKVAKYPVIKTEAPPTAKAPASQKSHPSVHVIPTAVSDAPVSVAKPTITETNPKTASKHKGNKQSEKSVLHLPDVEELIPNLAAIMEEAEKPKPKVEAVKPLQSIVPPSGAKPIDLQIIRVKKPQRKRREPDSGRGR
jgi:hypothetical protein